MSVFVNVDGRFYGPWDEALQAIAWAQTHATAFWTVFSVQAPTDLAPDNGRRKRRRHRKKEAAAEAAS